MPELYSVVGMAVLLAPSLQSNHPKASSTPPSVRAAMEAREAHQWDWIREAWNGDEAPYVKMRTDLDALALRGKLTGEVVEGYRQAWMKDRSNPQAVYRWAYGCYRCRAHDPLHP